MKSSGRVDRKFNESLILQYKETNDNLIFEQVIKDPDIKTYIKSLCIVKLRHSPTTLYSLDDLINIAYLIFWQSIHKYRFICPHCNLTAKTYAAYKLHAISKHGSFVEPKVSVTRYIKFNLGAYLQNEIRREYSTERKSNVMTINIFSPDEHTDAKGESESVYDNIEYTGPELSSEMSVENEIIFDDTVSHLMEKFDSLTQKIFKYLFNDRMKQNEIAYILYKEGRYSSEQSAKVVVSRILKSKINPVISDMYPELVKN